MQEDYERQLSEMEEGKEQSLEQLTEYYETKIQVFFFSFALVLCKPLRNKPIQVTSILAQELNQKLETTSDEGTQQNKEYEETKKQIEEDADREILDIKNKYERR